MMNAELLGYPGRPPRTASPRLLGYAGRTTRNMSPRLVGLGDYTEGTDFTCANGVCVPALASVNVLTDFSTLQGQLNRLLVASGMAPLTVDGQLGPSTLAAAQQMISHYGIQIAVPQTVDQLAAQTQLYAAEFESTGTINNLPQPTTSTSTAAAPYSIIQTGTVSPTFWSSMWPWAIGGVVVAAAGGGAFVYYRRHHQTSKKRGSSGRRRTGRSGRRAYA